MKSALLICTWLLVVAQLKAGEYRGARINPDGETTVTAVIGGSKLVAVFETSSIEIGKHDKTPRFPQCTYTTMPCILTRQIKTYLNGKEIFLPRSAYAGLGDVHSAELTSKGGLFILSIVGGDASESYIARIAMNRKRTLERRIYSGEDPYHALEVTKYYEVSAVD
jgi:hypothetical protein